MKTRLSLKILLVTLFAFSQTSQAWDALGHMIVAQIAYDQLSPEAKQKFDEAAAEFSKEKAGDRAVADAAYCPASSGCWMDDIRSLPDKYSHFAPWHYVELPFNDDGTPQPTEGPNVISGIEDCEGILAGRKMDAQMSKNQALFMLVHLVADIHQPLHATSHDDAGGNRVPVSNVSCPNAEAMFGKSTNLHFFWDACYRYSFRDGTAVPLYEQPIYDKAKPVTGHHESLDLIRQQAKALEQKYPASILKDQGVSNASEWARESHRLGFAFAYGTMPSALKGSKTTLNAAYVDKARAMGEERLALAGYRLGSLLEEHFKPE
jgi:hypothetical protein